MPKLNQIIAIANGKKSQSEAALTQVYHKLQKDGLITGLSRTYQAKDEDGDRFPAESKILQFRVSDALVEAKKTLTELFDVIAAQEYGNCHARANIVVDDKVILEDVPVTYLLFLEKQLLNVQALITKLPVLDPSQKWSYSEAQKCWAAEPVETVKTKKVPKAFVKYEATKEHPAQVEIFHEDVVTGYWTAINYSGATTQQSKTDMLERVCKLQEAVKKAREEANSASIDVPSIGKEIFEYLFV